MVASSLLVLTTGKQYCSRFVYTLPVVTIACPVEFPPMQYYQLWHERSHASAANRWLRERVKGVAASLKKN
jgi:DNA-binding transcriptional LysR family regulator